MNSVIRKHCLMHVCADMPKNKKDWTHPPVPNAASCVCHSPLVHIFDRAPQTFQEAPPPSVCVSVKVSVCVSMRDEGEADLVARALLFHG